MLLLLLLLMSFLLPLPLLLLSSAPILSHSRSRSHWLFSKSSTLLPYTTYAQCEIIVIPLFQSVAMCVCVFCLLSITRKLRSFNWQHYPLNTVGFWLSFDCFFLLHRRRRLHVSFDLTSSLSPFVSSFLSYSQIWNHSIETIFRGAVFFPFHLDWQDKAKQRGDGECVYMNQTKLNRNDSARKSIVSLYPMNNGILAIFGIATHTSRSIEISSFSVGLRLHW